MNRFAVVLGLVLAANLGCTKGSKSKDSGGDIAVPQVDGLALIHPKISAMAIASLETAAQGEVNKVSPQGRLLKRIQRNDHQIELLNAQIQKLEAERNSANNQYAGVQSQIDSHQIQAPMASDILELYRDGQKGELTADQIKIVEAYLNANRQYWKALDERGDLHWKIKNLGLWDSYVGGRSKELNNELEKKIEEVGKLARERQKCEEDLRIEERRVRDNQIDVKAKAERRRDDLRQKSNGLANRVSEITNAINQLHDRVQRLKEDSADAQNEIAKLGPEAKKSILEPLYASKKLALAKAINEGRKVRVSDLIDALILRDSVAYGDAIESSDELKAKLKSYAAGEMSTVIYAFKLAYENRLVQAEHQGRNLIYNKKAVTLVHPVREGKMQCYSGTNLFLTLNEMRKDPFRNLVVIFTDGHILPGFISAKGGTLNLNGIETTVEGKGIKNFGATREIEGRIRVFDNHQYLLTELFKGEIENFSDIYKEMLATVAKYGLRTDKLLSMELGSSSDSDTLNSSPLGFGIAAVADGDQKRETVDFEENLMFRAQKQNADGTPTIQVKAEPMREMPCSMIEEMSGKLSEKVICRDDEGKHITVREYLSRKKVSLLTMDLILTDGSTVQKNLLENKELLKCEKTKFGYLIESIDFRRKMPTTRLEIMTADSTQEDTDNGRDKRQPDLLLSTTTVKSSNIDRYLRARNQFACDRVNSSAKTRSEATLDLELDCDARTDRSPEAIIQVKVQIRCSLTKGDYRDFK